LVLNTSLSQCSELVLNTTEPVLELVLTPSSMPATPGTDRHFGTGYCSSGADRQ